MLSALTDMSKDILLVKTMGRSWKDHLVGGLLVEPRRLEMVNKIPFLRKDVCDCFCMFSFFTRCFSDSFDLL